MNMRIEKSDNTPEYGPCVFKRTNTAFLSEPLSECIFGTDAKVKAQLQEVLALLPPGAIVAGGFLADSTMNVTPKDIDIFFTSTTAAGATMTALFKAGYTVSDKDGPEGILEFIKDDKILIQLVLYSYYEDVSHLLDGFDFTVCQMAICGDRLYYGPETLGDIETSALRLHRLNLADGRSLKHALRYIQKGYKLLPDTLKAICLKKFPVVR